MDLRTIMNSDASGVAKPPPPPSQQSFVRQSSEPLNTPQLSEVSNSGPSYQAGYFARPPQPSLQSNQHSPSASSTYNPVRSSLQHNSTTILGGGTPSHHVQSPPPPAYQTIPRDSSQVTPASPAVFPQPSLASPYTPQPSSTSQQQQSYPTHFPPSQTPQHTPGQQSSIGYSPHASESPRSTNAQWPLQSQHQISPPPQRSQPGTPLGPPSGPYQRPPSQSVRPPSAGESTPVPAPNAWNNHDPYAPEQRMGNQQNHQAMQPTLRESSQGGRLSGSQYLPESDRERSVSISPKTIVSRQSLSQDRDGIAIHRTSMDDDRWRQSPSGSHSHNSSVTEHAKFPSHTPQQDFSQRPQTMQMQMSSSPLARQIPSHEAPAAHPPMIKSEHSETSDILGPPPKRKKIRYDEPPIYARRVPRPSGKGPIIPNPRPPISKNSPSRFSLHQRSTSIHGSAPSPSASLQTPAKAPSVNGTTPSNGRAFHTPQPEPTYGALGPWEPSISGKIPYEEITNVVCDFLFKEVVLRRDPAVELAGVPATGSKAILEIEAKLGKIMDKDRGGRLNLPVTTECILNTDTSGLRTAFESSMSLDQHRVMNNFLNEAVKASMPQAGLNRIPLSYAHKRERDTFYEVPPSEIPPILHNYKLRHKPKVRVTTDQKTGEVLAKIIKCRLADLDVYSPRTSVDWRISVNLEMSFDGNVQQFPVSDGGVSRGRAGGERIKDRMSYRHLAYQIDLTQVGTAESSIKNDFEHELEVELSAAEVRRQGELAKEGNERNQYVDLIKGFVDNVRFLARAVPSS